MKRCPGNVLCRGRLQYVRVREYSAALKLYIAKAFPITAGTDKRLMDMEIVRRLDQDRQRKISSIKHGNELTRSILAGLLLRHACLSEGYSEELWRQAEIAQEAYGKPYIKGLPEFNYSLSHSGDWAVCAVDNIPIGVDIQEMRQWKLQMAKRFYAQSEYGLLSGLGESYSEEQTALFYKMWTAKESCMKLTGRGIGAGISQYVANADFTKICAPEDTVFPIRVYDAISGYMMCVCSKNGEFPENITEVSFAGYSERQKE